MKLNKYFHLCQIPEMNEMDIFQNVFFISEIIMYIKETIEDKNVEHKKKQLEPRYTT